ncbi:TolB family protein, partial [Levilinea saccharolytica]
DTLPPPLTATPELPTPTLPPQATALGGDPGQIAFVSNRTGTYQIFTLRLDNNQVTQVTDLTDGACQPDWSPDGQRLVFVSPCRARQATYKGSSLFLINTDGSGLTPLVSSPGGDFEPDWSPDGAKIAFTSIRQNNVPYVFIYDLAANRAARLTNTATNEIRPTWSPSGEWIAFESTRLGVLQIWVMDAEGKNVREFSRQSDGAAAYPAWSPAGDVIVFSRGSNAQGLVSKQYPAISTDTFPVSEFRPALNAAYSPDGFWLLFESTQDGNLDLYRMNSLSGANLTRVTDDPAEDFDAVWRPASN